MPSFQLRMSAGAAGCLLALASLGAQAQSPARPQMPRLSLPAGLQGESALSALGSHLSAVAASHGHSAESFARLLRQDPSLRLDPGGRLYVVDELDAQQRQALAEQSAQEDAQAAQSAPLAADDLADTFTLHSRPQAKRTIYLNFTGATLKNNAWVGNTSTKALPFTLDADTSTFNTKEKRRIQAIWRRIAEDFAPFNVDVTTEPPPASRLLRSDANDQVYGTTVLITNSQGIYDCSCGGVAYVGVFDSVGNYYKPALVFYNQLYGGEKAIAEAASHEAGHTLGLSHDGYSGGGYYGGHGSGDTGWAPIMGVGYYKPVTQWSKGEYDTANNQEDDIQVIISNGLPLRADDHGNSIAQATPLTALPTGTGSSLSASGVIERTTDRDVFSFQTESAATVTIQAKPDSTAPNLDISVQVLDAQGTVLGKAQPKAALNATVRLTVPAAGSYYVLISGAGAGDPASTGYSRYGSLGQYTLSGSTTP